MGTLKKCSIAGVIGASALGAGSFGTTPAFASTGPGPGTTVYQLINVSDAGAQSGDWANCVYVNPSAGSQTITCEVSKSISGSYSLSGGFGVGILNAQLGYSADWTVSVGASGAYTINPGGSGWIQSGARYEAMSGDLQSRYCNSVGLCGAWGNTSRQTWQRYDGPTFQYTGSGLAK